MAYGLAMRPPAYDAQGHFIWYVLDDDNLPDVCVCPAANRENLFTDNPEVNFATQPECIFYKYAAFYQTSGTLRSATRMISEATMLQQGYGGLNPAVPHPSRYLPVSMPQRNMLGAEVRLWLCQKTGDPEDASQYGYEWGCFVQATNPSQIDDPSRVYYMADSRDYRPSAYYVEQGIFPAGINDGWHSGYGNLVFMSTRHHGYANVMYMDGQVNRDGQAHLREEWNMACDGTQGSGTSNEWRCSTFSSRMTLAGIGTQSHIMPVLNIVGWEYFFNANGQVPR